MPAPATRAALERVFQILETLALHPDGRPLKELSTATGIHSSTLSRICSNLVALGLVRKSNYRVFAVDAGLVYLGIRAMDAFRIPAPVEQILQDAAAEGHMQVALGTRHRHYALYLHRAGRSLQKDVHPSLAFHPLHSSNIGLTVLAMENPSLQDEKNLLQESYERAYEKKIPAPLLKQLLSQLAATKQEGYGVLGADDQFNAAFPFRWRDRWYSVALFGRLGKFPGARRETIALTCLLRDKIERAIQPTP